MSIFEILLLVVLLGTISMLFLLLQRMNRMSERMANQETMIAVQRESAANMEQAMKDLSFGSNRQLESMALRINNLTNTNYQQMQKMIEDIGAMQSMSRDVGDIKKVLLNVKTNGNMGEYQLESILMDMLAPNQFAKQFRLVPQENTMVDFAVRMPTQGGETVYLPIDSKNPSLGYSVLMDAYEAGDKDAIEQSRKKLVAEIRREAKDIASKYIRPPYTVDFAVLFLPSEGLFGEAVRLGLVETLRKESSVVLAGPTTMAALLSSFRVGYQSVTIAEKAKEVRQVLEEVRVQFEKYDEVLAKAETHMRQSLKDVETLRSTRTTAVRKALDKIAERGDTAEF